MRDPDQCRPCRVTAFFTTLQHFLTITHRFSKITRRRVALHYVSGRRLTPPRRKTSRSGQLGGRDELEDSLHDELRRNGGQQQAGDLCQQHDAAGPQESGQHQ